MKINLKLILFATLIMLCMNTVLAVPYTDGTNLQVTFMSQTPDPAEPGKYVELRWKAENYGSDPAEDVVFELVPEFPFSLEPGQNATKRIGLITATGDYASTIYYKVKVDENAVEGDNEIKLRYKIGNQGWVSKDYDIRILTHDAVLKVKEIKSDPERVSPGKEVKVNIKVKNMADSLLKDIKIRLEPVVQVPEINAMGMTTMTYIELPFTPLEEGFERIIKRLDSGEEELLIFKMIVDGDAETKPYKIPLTITYKDKEGTSYSITDMVGILVDAAPELMLNLEESEIIETNNKGNVIFSLSNIGPSQVKFASMEILSSKDYKILSAPKIYLGNLDPDDYETAEFELYLKSSKKEKEIPIKLQITYKDNYNKDYSKTEQINLKLYSSADIKKMGLKEKSNIIGIIIVIVIVVGSLFAYIVWNKKRKKAKGK